MLEQVWTCRAGYVQTIDVIVDDQVPVLRQRLDRCEPFVVSELAVSLAFVLASGQR